MMPKPRKQLELEGTFHKCKHGHLLYEFKGEKIVAVEPARGWKKPVKEQFEFLTENLVKYEMLLSQDIPSLYMLGDYLEEINFVKVELKKAKKQDAPEMVFKYQNQLMKLTKAFTDLARKYYITPDARNKALANMVRANEEGKLNKALELITQGSL